MSDDEVKATLWEGEQARHQMIQANLRLVVVVAKKFQNRGLSLPDLIQEGSLGLIRGIEKFDPDRGCRLSTYCWHWIRQAVTHAINQKSRTIYLPTHILDKLNRIKKASRHLSGQLGRTPTVPELATELKLEPEVVRKLLRQGQKPISLNLRVGDGDAELGEFLPETIVLPEDYAVNAALTVDLKRLIANLTPQQREVLSLRFGMVNGQALSLAEIGRQLNLSREHVRQIERHALEKLSQRKQVLQDYLVSS